MLFVEAECAVEEKETKQRVLKRFCCDSVHPLNSSALLEMEIGLTVSYLPLTESQV